MDEVKESKLKKGTDLKKISANVYLDLYDNKIVIRKTVNGKSVKIYTPYGEKQIKLAKDFSEKEILNKYLNESEKEKREKKGIKNPTIESLWNECISLRAPKKAKSTLKKYEVAWNYGLSGFFKHLTVSDFDHNTVPLFESWYLKNKSNRVFFNTGKSLTMLINFMWQNGYLDKLDEKPKVTDLDKEVLDYKNKKKAVGRVYTKQEINDLLKHADPRTKLGIMFGRFLGCRKGEFLGVKWSNINFKKEEVDLWSSKNKKWRTVPLPDILLKELKQYENSQRVQTDYVFYSPSNPKRHISSQVFDKGWTKAKELAKIKGASDKNAARVHDLRHSFATQTAEDGWPVRTACELLDMSIHEYEKTYTHVSSKAKTILMKKGFAKW